MILRTLDVVRMPVLRPAHSVPEVIRRVAAREGERTGRRQRPDPSARPPSDGKRVVPEASEEPLGHLPRLALEAGEGPLVVEEPLVVAILSLALPIDRGTSVRDAEDDAPAAPVRESVGNGRERTLIPAIGTPSPYGVPDRLHERFRGQWFPPFLSSEKYSGCACEVALPMLPRRSEARSTAPDEHVP